MSTTIPVPLWLVLLFVVLTSAQIALGAWQSKNLHDLFDLYWHEVHGDDFSTGTCANCNTNGPLCACMDYVPKVDA
jgi:hypothetical protein